VQDKYNANAEPHYVFNPRHLTEWVDGLKRYALDGVDLMEAVAYEGTRIFRDRLVGPDSAKDFDNLLLTVMKVIPRVAKSLFDYQKLYRYIHRIYVYIDPINV
jgi:hypothetical protein